MDPGLDRLSKTSAEALGSYLDEIGDASPMVEYWSRQEWKHIEAHADVDERRASAAPGEPLRFPTMGHVLYLSVGPRVQGPTCVWQPDPHDGSPFGALATVPAVAGRVLRFEGFESDRFTFCKR